MDSFYNFLDVNLTFSTFMLGGISCSASDDDDNDEGPSAAATTLILTSRSSFGEHRV